MTITILEHLTKRDLQRQITKLRGQVDINAASVNQTLQDFHIILRDPDVDHGMISLVDSDVLGTIGFRDEFAGGINILGFSDDDKNALLLQGNVGQSSTTNPAMIMSGWKKSGTGRAAIENSGSLFEIRNGGVGKITVLGDGSIRTKGTIDLNNQSTARITLPVGADKWATP